MHVDFSSNIMDENYVHGTLYSFTCTLMCSTRFLLRFILHIVETFISSAPIVYVDGYFYVIGGWANLTPRLTIGRLNAITTIWSIAGNLVHRRRGHNVIYDGASLIVVGGISSNSTEPIKTEKCSFFKDQVICTAQNPELYHYIWTPELFLVPYNYCKALP